MVYLMTQVEPGMCCPVVAAEAMESPDGMESKDTAKPGLYRVAPLKGIWEGRAT